MLQFLRIALVTCCALTEYVARADEAGMLDPLNTVDDPTAILRTRRLIFGGMFSDKSNSFKYEKVKKTVGGKLTVLGIPIGLSVTYGTRDGSKPQHGRKIENVKQVTKIENKSAGAKGKFLGLGIGAELNMQVSKKETQGDLAPPNPVVMLPPTAVNPPHGPVGSGPPSGKAISAIQPLVDTSALAVRSYPLNEKIQFSLPFISRNEIARNVDSKINRKPDFSLPFTSMKKFSKTQIHLNINAADSTDTPTRIRSKVDTKIPEKSNGNRSEIMAFQNEQSRRKRSYILKYAVLPEVPYYRMVPPSIEHPVLLTGFREIPQTTWNPTRLPENAFSNFESNMQNKTLSMLQDVYDRVRNPWSSQNVASPRPRPVWFHDFQPALKETLAGVQKQILKKRKKKKAYNDISIISTFNEGGEMVPYVTTISLSDAEQSTVTSGRKYNSAGGHPTYYSVHRTIGR